MSHVAEADTGDTELLEGTAGTAIDDVAVTQTDRGRIAGQLLQAEACSLALLSEFDVLADLGVVLLQNHAVRIVTTVLTGYVGVTRARGRLELDDRTYVLVLSH